MIWAHCLAWTIVHPLKKMAFRLVVIQLITAILTILIGEWMGSSC